MQSHPDKNWHFCRGLSSNTIMSCKFNMLSEFEAFKTQEDTTGLTHAHVHNVTFLNQLSCQNQGTFAGFKIT